MDLQRSYEDLLDWMFPMVLAHVPALLIVDSACPHFSVSTRELLSSRNVLLKVIPGGLTSLLQPADVFHFAKLKRLLKEKVDKWIDTPPSAEELTRGQNRRPPAVSTYAPWAVHAWQQISTQYIAESFQKCLLGDVDSLYISKDDDIGDLFRAAWLGIHRSSLEALIESEAIGAEDILTDCSE